MSTIQTLEEVSCVDCGAKLPSEMSPWIDRCEKCQRNFWEAKKTMLKNYSKELRSWDLQTKFESMVSTIVQHVDEVWGDTSTAGRSDRLARKAEFLLTLLRDLAVDLLDEAERITDRFAPTK